MSAQFEEQLFTSTRIRAVVQQLPLDQGVADRLRESPPTAINADVQAVLLTTVRLRKNICSMIAHFRSDMPVLYYYKLLPTVKLDVLPQAVLDESVKSWSVKNSNE